ncbi:MAG: succinate dehydrogenase iron-sulfur subunit [Thermoplasmata archaeon]
MLQIVRITNGIREGFEEYSILADRFTTVLDALLDVRENQNSSIQFRYSCRMGMCGSCGMKINRKPRLACQTLISQVGTVIKIEPMDHLPIIRDLVPYLDEFFLKYKSVKPYLIEKSKEYQDHPSTMNKQYEWQIMEYLSSNYCIQCALCYSACPIVGSDKNYLGPAALNVAFRYTADSRDTGARYRLEIVSGEEGTSRCHFVGECTEVCPKEVNPSYSIQKLRGKMVKEELKNVYGGN